MSNNHKQLFKYYCETENKWITEERDKNTPPTQCKNDAGHTLKANSVYITVGDYCNYTDDTTIPEEFDLNTLNYSSLSANEKKIVEVLRSLLICAKYRGLIVLN